MVAMGGREPGVPPEAPKDTLRGSEEGGRR